MDNRSNERRNGSLDLAQPSKTLAVIGGGLTGIASALTAANAGWNVTLFEARRHLGGRVASIETPDGLIDNGRHLILDVCSETRRLIRRLGADRLFDRVEKITFLDPGGRRPYLWRFGASKLFFGRWRFFPSFAAMPLSWGQKRRLFETLWRLARFDGPDRPFGDFLDFAQTSKEVRTRFWNPIIFSALCDSPDAVSTLAVKSVVFSGVFGQYGPALTIPNVPLREIFHDKALRLLEKERITVRLGAPIQRLIHDERPAILAGCETAVGEITRFDRLILAAAPRGAERLLRNSGFDDFANSLGFERFLPGAITAVHLWLDRRLSDEPVVLDGEPGQWLFPAPSDKDAKGDFFYHQVLISGSHCVFSEDRPTDEYLSERIETQLRRHFPQIPFSLQKSRVTTVPDAVSIPTPALFGARPTGVTPFENFSLAGDWLETGWPSTMEGAIRSGSKLFP